MVGRGVLMSLFLLLGAGQAISSEPEVLTLTVPWGMWKEDPGGQPLACARFVPKKAWNGIKQECAEYLPPQAFLDTRFNGRARVVDAKPASAMASALVISFRLVDPPEAPPTSVPAEPTAPPRR